MAVAAGLALPPVGSALRTIWPRVVGQRRSEHGVCDRRFPAGADLRRRARARGVTRRNRPGRGRVRGGRRRCRRHVRVLAPPARPGDRPRAAPSTDPVSAPCPPSGFGRSRCSRSGSGSASARSRSRHPRSPRARGIARSQASPSPASPRGASSAGSPPGCARRATSAGGSSSAPPFSPRCWRSRSPPTRSRR